MVIDPHHDPSSPSAPEGAALEPKSSLMVSADDPPPEKSASDDRQMKDMPGMQGLAEMEDLPEMKSGEMSPAIPTKTIYTCPMHPEVQQDKPGEGPKCGMTLVVKRSGGGQ